MAHLVDMEYIIDRLQDMKSAHATKAEYEDKIQELIDELIYNIGVNVLNENNLK